jgi:hypothetical protein
MESLRKGISDTVNELNKLLRLTSDPEQETRLRQLRRIYYLLWEEVIEKEIDKNTADYKAALDSLDLAHDTIETAKRDIKKIAEAIDKAVAAAKAVNKIVDFGFDMLV